MYCIYNNTTGFIYGYYPLTFDIEELLLQWEDSAYIEIELSQVPPRNEVGQWIVDVNTQQLTKI